MLYGRRGAVKRRAGSGREGLEGWKGGTYPGVRRGDEERISD